MKKQYFLIIFIFAFVKGKTQTIFRNSTEGVAVPILKLSSGTGTTAGSGGSIEFYKGLEAHPMGRIYTSNLYSAGIGNSIGKLTLSSYYNAYKDEVTLYNGNVGIGTPNPITDLHVNGFVSLGGSVTTANATRTLNVADPNAVLRIIRIHATSAPAVELISRTSADGANVAYWDCYAQPADASFRIRDRQGGGSGIDMFTISHTTGNVGIGTTNPGPYKLAVEGKIGAREIKVTLANPWADYVFNKSYQLRSLYDLEKFVQLNKHLPGIPSASKVEESGGIELGRMNIKLLEKVEELTLYVIQLKKENDEIKKQLKKMQKKG